VPFAGRKFKKSVEKDKSTLEFAPTNLHIQQMKVTVGESMNILIVLDEIQYVLW